MSALFKGWGLGIETAEYWHWLARNHRSFADLLGISEVIIVGENEIEQAIKPVTGDTIVYGDTVLHHPGYYYSQAAECLRQELAKMRSLVVIVACAEANVDRG